MSAGVAVVAILVLFLAITLGGGLLLYTLVRSEGRNDPVVDREQAEHLARRDTGRDDK